MRRHRFHYLQHRQQDAASGLFQWTRELKTGGPFFWFPVAFHAQGLIAGEEITAGMGIGGPVEAPFPERPGERQAFPCVPEQIRTAPVRIAREDHITLSGNLLATGWQKGIVASAVRDQKPDFVCQLYVACTRSYKSLIMSFSLGETSEF